MNLRYENVKTPAFFSSGCLHRRSFRSFVDMVNRLYDVQLSMPEIYGSYEERVSKLKSFCGRMIESSDHPWHSIIDARRLSQDSRHGIAMSLFLFRKCIPSPKPCLDSYVKHMSKPSPDGDPGFMAFIRKRIAKMFPVGWDISKYPNAALSSTLTLSSCLQWSRGKGGCRFGVVGGGISKWDDHISYVERVLTEGDRQSILPSKVSAVETGGKWRIVSTSDVEMNILRPLHTAIYNNLSPKWLLRGEASTNRFSSFLFKKGEVFVSGDYESATDNLNFNVQRCILQSILDGCVTVPHHVREMALESQSLTLVTPSGLEAKQRSGQLMGNLLSFPLLCLVNYLAFRYYGGYTATRDCPVKINGDDIVFRSSKEVYERWRKGVVGSGLTLSAGKTMVHGHYFSLNSKLFVSRGKTVRLVPSLRCSAFGFRTPSDPIGSLEGRWNRVLKDFPCGSSRRLHIEEAFLRFNRKFIWASRRSLTRGLGLRFQYPSLIKTNLWQREAWYLSLDKESPLPPSPSITDQKRIPDGWERRVVENVTKEMRMKEREIAGEFVQMAWSDISLTPRERFEQWDRDRLLSPAFFLGATSMNRKARLLGMSVQNAKRYLVPTVRVCGKELSPYEALQLRPRGTRLWLPVGFFDSTSLVQLHRERWSDIKEDQAADKKILELDGSATIWKEIDSNPFSRIRNVVCGDGLDRELVATGPGAKILFLKGGGIGIGPPTSF